MDDDNRILERGGTIATRYGNQDGTRQISLDRGRAVSALTVPQLLPPQGHNEYTELPTPFNDTGAYAVNNLVNKLFLTLFPVSTPFFTFKISEAIIDELVDSGNYQAKQDIEKKLRAQEEIVQSDMETSGMRPALHNVLRHLVVVGDVLLHLPKEGAPRVYRADTYVCKRSHSGVPLSTILKQQLHLQELLPEWLVALDDSDSEDEEIDSGKEEKCFDVFTEIWLSGDHYLEQSYLKGKPLEGTFARYKKDETAWLPLRWSAESGEDFGRSYGYEYLGALKALEGYHKSIREHSAIASRTIGLLSRTSRLNIKDLIEGKNGSIFYGEEGELTFPEVGKYNDMRVVESMIQSYSSSINKAFLVVQTRDAERVTAEEIRLTAQELETALGGAYSLLAKTLQEPLLRRQIARLTDTGSLKEFDNDKVKPKVIVGLEGLGKGSDIEKLRRIGQLAGELGQVAQFIPKLNVDGTIQSLFNWEGLDPSGILYTDTEVQENAQGAKQAEQEQFQQEQQAQMAQTMVPQAMQGMMNTDSFKQDPQGSIENMQQQIAPQQPQG